MLNTSPKPSPGQTDHPPTEPNLRALAARLRLTILEVHRRAGAGHLGSSLSIVEILTLIFQRHLSWAPDSIPQEAGDRFVLSKGHAALALYCQLHLLGRLGVPVTLFGSNGSPLEPHPNERVVPAVNASTGSLGQGLSIGLGLALGSRLAGRVDRTFVVIGDGETNEGQIWEAAQVAGHLRLSNLIVVLDCNGFQQDGPMTDILPPPDFSCCWDGFGWAVADGDGHDCAELDRALACLIDSAPDRPKLLVAHTIKGRGVPFLEDTTESHYPPPLTTEEIDLIRYQMMGGGT